MESLKGMMDHVSPSVYRFLTWMRPRSIHCIATTLVTKLGTLPSLRRVSQHPRVTRGVNIGVSHVVHIDVSRSCCQVVDACTSLQPIADVQVVAGVCTIRASLQRLAEASSGLQRLAQGSSVHRVIV